MPEFGTLADWDELLAAMHQRGLKLVMDLVVNHTSDEHPWFIEARKSKDNPYRDYYLWRPPRDGREPNNWVSIFGGSAWQYDDLTGEYYLHLFSRKQPDLNWENPRVRGEVFDMMLWWLDRGIDGFRMDVINMISKVPGLPDAPEVTGDRYQPAGRYYINGPRLLEYLDEMKQEVLSRYDILTVGETPHIGPAQALTLVDQEHGALNMVFQFEHMHLDADPQDASSRRSYRPWSLLELKQVITRWQKDLENRGWNSNYLTNHDQPRAVSRFGDDGEYRVESAKLLATFTFLLQGTPYIYQGEEIGMTNVAFETIEDYRDIATLNIYREVVEGQGIDPKVVMPFVHLKSRDNARTPMQWDNTPQAGFTTGEPWIKVNPNYQQINVRQALADPASIFYYYQKLIRLRREHPVMVYGTYDLILDNHPQIYAFTRSLDSEQLLVILNFSKDTPVFELPGDVSYAEKQLLINNYPVDEAEKIQRIELRPYEGRVYRFQMKSY
jgi:oligo-1,6-glucosidase